MKRMYQVLGLVVLQVGLAFGSSALAPGCNCEDALDAEVDGGEVIVYTKVALDILPVPYDIDIDQVKGKLPAEMKWDGEYSGPDKTIDEQIELPGVPSNLVPGLKDKILELVENAENFKALYLAQVDSTFSDNTLTQPIGSLKIQIGPIGETTKYDLGSTAGVNPGEEGEDYKKTATIPRDQGMQSADLIKSGEFTLYLVPEIKVDTTKYKLQPGGKVHIEMILTFEVAAGVAPPLPEGFSSPL